MKKILVVNNSKEQTEKIMECLSEYEYFSEIRFSESGKEALKLAKEFKSDIVFSALVMPDGDGIWLSERLKEELFGNDISLFIISEKISSVAEKLLYDIGVLYVFEKTTDISKVIKKIIKLTGNKKIPDKTVTVQMEKYMEKYQDIILKDIGMPEKSKGYKYLSYAIAKVIENKELLHNMTKELYPMIAEAYKNKAANVERAMRHAISLAWKEENKEKISKYFGADAFSSDKKMSNSEFIAKTADAIVLRNF